MKPDIQTTADLVRADFGQIHLAEIKLTKGSKQIAGRIVDRWNSDLTLRYRGHEHDVTSVDKWRLERYQHATDEERQLIQSEWGEE